MNTDIIIIGGGMVGLGLACALRNTDVRITILEKAWTAPRLSMGHDMRVSAIVQGTKQALQGIGVWQHVRRQCPIMGMQIWDNQQTGGIRFAASEIDQDMLGAIVENSVLHTAMQEALLDFPNITMQIGCAVQSIQTNAENVCVNLKDNKKISASLLVGADGANSFVRQQLNIKSFERDYKQAAIVATVRTLSPHRNQAYQRFLATGPLAFLPLNDDLCSIVWSAYNDESQRLMALDNQAFIAELNLKFGPVLGGIANCGERGLFPLKARLSKHMVRSRLALIGDAAHVIHPLAGLGVNLGLRDALCLAREIDDARNFDEDIGGIDVLRRLIPVRMPDNLATMASMELLHRVFSNDLPILAKIRSHGMTIASNIHPLKSMLMRAATGLSLPVPKQIGKQVD
ncbi:MAG: UbiH/UbiF/VisC/COQ6 family ubiquinone biosynthesis hydroxylase [Mariprofundales bacterium]